jgi:CheY-like chemotaxis protein
MADLLIVEDDDALRDALQEVLTRLGGHEVRAAKSGQAALSAVESGMPDLIISDVRMPGITGTQLLDKVRTRRQWRHIPFLFISASIVEEVEREIAALDGVFYLRKPFKVESIQEAVITALKTSSRVTRSDNA